MPTNVSEKRKIQTMDEQKQQLVDRIKQAQNILVTVSANPSVDQLAAAIGLTLALNKLDKHGTAVFSGQVPSTLEFLKPEETLEKNTDSLRDFIIALDKSKADKLRYKVEDDVVRIFITPYRTNLSESDLEFSQGDFNVDVVVCLGVAEQHDLDAAITAHGRILHDATVVSVSTQGQGSLGSINWVDPGASALSEMILNLVDGLDKKLLDGQIATALLTGIVATTDRFRNEKTTPKTMSASAELMAAGANQQLIATELEPEVSAKINNQGGASSGSAADPAKPAAETPKSEPGTLEIDHEAGAEEAAAFESPTPEPPNPQVQVDAEGRLITEGQELPEISGVKGVSSEGAVTEGKQGSPKRERITEPPRLADGELTANTTPEGLDPSTEELTLPPVDAPLLNHNENVLPPTPAPQPPKPAEPFMPLQPAPPVWQPPVQPDPLTPDTTLAEIEQSVDSPHLHEPAPDTAAVPATDNIDNARSLVDAAYNAGGGNNALQPIAALNAQPLGVELHDVPTAPPVLPTSAPGLPPVPNTGFSEPTPGTSPADETLDMPLPSNPFGPSQPLPPASLPSTPPSAFPGAPQQGVPGQAPPPPVPPPPILQ